MLGIKKSVDVKCVGHTLVAGFHCANPPLIWKFDLERNHSFTISLQGEDGDWELGLTSPKGDFYPIARFINRELADEAFHALQKILMKSKLPLPALPKTLLGWLGLLALCFVLVILAHLAAVSVRSHGATLANVPGAPLLRPGVPQAADDLLK